MFICVHYMQVCVGVCVCSVQLCLPMLVHVEARGGHMVFCLSYSLKIGSLSEPGVCCFSARLTGQQGAVRGFPVSACIALK